MSDWDAYWDKLQTGLAGGAAPDVFAMDGPLVPGLPGAATSCSTSSRTSTATATTSASSPTRRSRTSRPPTAASTACRATSTSIALYYNKDMFDAAGIPYPDDTWDWAKLVEVGKQLTKDTDGDGTTDQWGFYTETTDMENYWSSLVWQNGGDILAAGRQDDRARHRPRPRAASSSSRT